MWRKHKHVNSTLHRNSLGAYLTYFLERIILVFISTKQNTEIANLIRPRNKALSCSLSKTPISFIQTPVSNSRKKGKILPREENSPCIWRVTGKLDSCYFIKHHISYITCFTKSKFTIRKQGQKKTQELLAQKTIFTSVSRLMLSNYTT